MSALDLYRASLAVWLALAALSFVALFRRPAPYGRHATGGAGGIPARWGWILMESPAVVGMAACFLAGSRRDAVSAAFLTFWLAHYVDRAWLYPFRLPATARPMPWSVVALAFAFQSVNVALHGIWLFDLGPSRSTAWLAGPPFLAGAALFATGFAVNRIADRELLRLRRGGGYGVPEGWLFRRISCPNYLGEIVLWCGWALLTWSPPGLAFALWTIANLAPRAWRHHRWYRERFAKYPRERRALLPGLW